MKTKLSQFVDSSEIVEEEIVVEMEDIEEDDFEDDDEEISFLEDTSTKALLKGTIADDIVSIGGVNFDEIFSRTVALFKEGVFTSDKNDIASLEMTRAKANSVLDSLGHLMQVNELVEFVKAEAARFKRSDELKILNALRDQCEKQAVVGSKLIGLVCRRLDAINDDIEAGNLPDLDQMQTLQQMLDDGVDLTSKIVNSVSKLIQLERFSGGRAWGSRSGNGITPGNIRGLVELKDSVNGDREKTGKPRKLSSDDTARLLSRQR